jgi:hypothetical protein
LLADFSVASSVCKNNAAASYAASLAAALVHMPLMLNNTYPPETGGTLLPWQHHAAYPPPPGLPAGMAGLAGTVDAPRDFRPEDHPDEHMADAGKHI